MPGTDYQSTAAHIGRSLLSFRRDQVHAMEGPHDPDAEFEAFQKQVSDRFNDLSSAADELLSLSWIRKLLGVFLSCQEDFRIILLHNKSHLVKSPMDRMIADFYERSVKALDVCNAIRDGIEQIRQWQRLLEIVLCALDANGGHKTIGEGQFRRAKKALVDLTIGMLDDKDSVSAISHRNRSFGRNNIGQSSKENHRRQLGHFRSLSWSVSRSWSAAKQLQAIGANLNAPRGNEITTTNGLAVPVYTMGNVLLFAMWVLVAAIPCQDRGLHIHLNVPRQFPWAASMLSLHDRIMEESKKRDKKNACGLLKEIYLMERCSRVLSELADSVQFPLTEEKESEVRQRVHEVAHVFGLIKEDLDPLEKQVREAFHRIVRSRTEGLDSSGRGSNGE